MKKNESSFIGQSNTEEETKVSQYNSIMSPYSSMNKESIQNKFKWKGTSQIKGIGSILNSNEVVNETDESQNEDSILRKSKEQNIEGEDGSSIGYSIQEKVSYLNPQNELNVHKDRYEEQKDLSMNQTQSKLLFDTSMINQMKHPQNPTFPVHENLTADSKDNILNNLNSNNF